MNEYELLNRLGQRLMRGFFVLRYQAKAARVLDSAHLIRISKSSAGVAVPRSVFPFTNTVTGLPPRTFLHHMFTF